MKKKPKKTKTYHHGDLRNSLITAAVKFLESESSETLSLRGLAIKLGVSQAAPYRHFKDKDELLSAISQEGFEIQYKYMCEAMKKNRTRPRELYHGFAQAYFRMGLDHPQHFRIMMGGKVKPCPERPALNFAASKVFALVKIMVETCQKTGVIGAGDPYFRAFQCWSVVNGFTSLYCEDRVKWMGIEPDNAREALRTMTEQLLNGFSKPLDDGFKIFSTKFSNEPLQKLQQSELFVRQNLNEV